MKSKQLDLLPKERKGFSPPTLEEVLLIASKIGLTELEATKFWYFYAAKDWFVGKTKMKYWAMALSGWKLRAEEHQRQATFNVPPHIQLKSVEHLIINHPANKESTRFNPDRTKDQIAELKRLREKRDYLHRLIASA